MEFKSTFSTSKVMQIWLVLIGVFLFPWLVLWFQFDKVIAIFAILANVGVCAVVLLLKIGVKISIYPEEQLIEYYWMTLWGRKRQVNIYIKNAHINLDIIQYKGNDLWNLIITDNQDLNKKIQLTEIMDGFDGQQIKDLYKSLNAFDVDEVGYEKPPDFVNRFNRGTP